MQQEHEPHNFHWLHYASLASGARSIDIKVEPSNLESPSSLLSPPSSPSLPRTERTSHLPSSLCRRRSVTSLTSPKRARPYPPLLRDNRSRTEESPKMATTPAYGPWSQQSRTGNSRPVQSLERRTSDNEYPIQTSYSAYPPHSFTARSTERSDPRSQSSSSSLTSSLTGAMGDTHISSHSRHSGSPEQQEYGLDLHQGMVWSPPPTQQMSASSLAYSGVPGHGNIPYNVPSSTATNNLQYQGYNSSTYHNSPESLSPPSPPFTAYGDQFAFHNARSQPTPQMRPSGSTTYSYPTTSISSANRPVLTPQEKLESEVHHLRKRMHELELVNDHARERIKSLESELANDITYNQRASSSSSAMGSLPSPLSTPSPQSTTFQASWKARTDARVRQFCSLNRAGNALCAWHDSRRERRAYPPRMAPPGHLNCGCTYEEALFEESLARHGVGSYHPGETVRMDPALRNPLLKLLQSRYGYRDGDFERDPITGDWVEGEGNVYWEQRAQAGANARKNRGDSDRR